MSGITVYLVLYNYCDCDYSIVKIMEKLEDAYNYICKKEKEDLENHYEMMQMITINHEDEISNKISDESLNICYLSSGRYHNFSPYEYCDISNYIIVPNVIE